jgi:diguanylate cyclase (GGDEF)-like protein/PAS domain S-box-containing protein
MDLTSELLQRQLFRYALDLQEVLSQQSKLLQRHQKLLHFMGRGEPGDDLLLNTLLQQVKLYFVTNAQGEIWHASPDMEKALGLGDSELSWRTIDTLMPADQHAVVQQVLGTLERQESSSAVLQRRLLLTGAGEHCGTAGYDALIIKAGSGVRAEIHWLMHPVKHSAGAHLEILKAFPLFGAGSQGMLMTDASGLICAVNAAFSAITGYSSAEAVGKNPRMLSSGLQEPEFYQAFWKQLTQAGCWNGELFNRRKNGQVYFEWATIKQVQNADGEAVSYLAVFSDLSHKEDGTHEISELAFHDPLTGLPNRRLLENHMAQAVADAKRNQTGFGVLFIHGDLGKGVSDAALLEVARRVQAAVRPGDIAARVGVDEFVVLLPNVDSEEAVAGIISFLLYALDAPIQDGIRSLYARLSVGAALFPQQGDDKTTLLARSESAMVSAKRLGRRYCFWKTD